jgi:hypothetical protein
MEALAQIRLDLYPGVIIQISIHPRYSVLILDSIVSYLFHKDIQLESESQHFIFAHSIFTAKIPPGTEYPTAFPIMFDSGDE